MDNTDFMNMYDDYLAHRWVTSKEQAKREQQKKAEQEYNKKYYREHRSEILDDRRKALGKESLRRYDRNFTSEEALADLNKRQEELSGLKRPADTSSELTDKIMRTRIEKYMIDHGVDKDEATRQVKAEIARDTAEQKDIDIRNRRAARTAQAQAENQRASDAYNRQLINARESRERSYNRNARVSEAQSEAASTRRESNRKKRTAQAQAENQRASDAYNRQQRALKTRSYSDTMASKAQADAAKKRTAYQQSIEGKINRAVSRSAKKVSNIVNGAKAAIQTAKNVYNDTSAKANKIKASVQRTLNKYFG